MFFRKKQQPALLGRITGTAAALAMGMSATIPNTPLDDPVFPQLFKLYDAALSPTESMFNYDEICPGDFRSAMLGFRAPLLVVVGDDGCGAAKTSFINALLSSPLSDSKNDTIGGTARQQCYPPAAAVVANAAAASAVTPASATTHSTGGRFNIFSHGAIAATATTRTATEAVLRPFVATQHPEDAVPTGARLRAVRLPNPQLTSMTIVDTPDLDGVDESHASSIVSSTLTWFLRRCDTAVLVFDAPRLLGAEVGGIGASPRESRLQLHVGMRAVVADALRDCKARVCVVLTRCGRVATDDLALLCAHLSSELSRIRMSSGSTTLAAARIFLTSVGDVEAATGRAPTATPPTPGALEAPAVTAADEADLWFELRDRMAVRARERCIEALLQRACSLACHAHWCAYVAELASASASSCCLRGSASSADTFAAAGGLSRALRRFCKQEKTTMDPSDAVALAGSCAAYCKFFAKYEPDTFPDATRVYRRGLLSDLDAARVKILPALRSAVARAAATSAGAVGAHATAEQRAFLARVAMLLAQHQQQQPQVSVITANISARSCLGRDGATNARARAPAPRSNLHPAPNANVGHSRGKKMPCDDDDATVCGGESDVEASFNTDSSFGRTECTATMVCSLTSRPCGMVRVSNSGEFSSPTPRSMFVPPPPAVPSAMTICLPDAGVKEEA